MSEQLKPIKLHNSLAQAKYALNTSEEKLFIYAIKNMDQNNKMFVESKFNLSDFAEYANLDIKRLYKDIKEMIENIMRTIIYVRKGTTDKWTAYNLTQKCDYDKGVITLKFSNDMKPMLLQLKEHYFYQLPTVVSFKSWYSIRIYNLLKSQSYKSNEIDCLVEDLKIMLGLENKYSKFSNFKSRVLDAALKEINNEDNCCDIFVDYNVIYSKRTPEIIKFTVTREDKEINKFIEQNYNIPKMVNTIGLESEGFNSSQIMEFYQLAIDSFTNSKDEDDLFLYMKLNYDYTKERKKTGNPSAYFKESLKNDYAKAIPQIINAYIIEQ